MFPRLRLIALLALLAVLPLPAAATASPDLPLPATAGAQAVGARRIYLPLVVARMPPVVPPSPFDLIEAARQAGSISDETAILYRVYAAFGDPALPAAYAGQFADGLEADSAIRDAQAGWNGLSPATQRALAPFFQPPIYVGSWWDRRHFPQSAVRSPDDEPGPTPLERGGWHFVLSAMSGVKVWWHEDYPAWTAEVARATASIMDKAWMAETGLMRRVPLPDTGVHRFTDLEGVKQAWGDGGDDRFDIYLAECLGCGTAQTVGYPPACTHTPAFMLMRPDYGWNGGSASVDTKSLEYALAHEMMHGIQFAYKYAAACGEYLDFDEAAAEWAVDYVFSDNQKEHHWSYRFRDANDSLYGPDSAGYEDWVFPFYLAHDITPDLIRVWWEEMERAGPFKALDTALAPYNGLRNVYPIFGLMLWNRPPVDFYQQHDQVPDRANGHPLREYQKGEPYTDNTQVVTLGAARAAEYKLPIKMPGLSVRFFHFTFPDDSVSTVYFSNPFGTTPNPDVKIQALVKIQGRADWEQPQNWTADKAKVFCRDLRDERIEELVIAISYARWQDWTPLQSALPPRLVVTNIGCVGWQGTATATHTYNTTARHDVETSSATVEFERKPPVAGAEGLLSFRVKQGSVHWEHNGSSTDCTITATPVDRALQPSEGSITINISSMNMAGIGSTDIMGSQNVEFELQWTCPESSHTEPWSPMKWVYGGPTSTRWLTADPRKIQGRYEVNLGGQGWESVYEFHLDATH